MRTYGQTDKMLTYRQTETCTERNIQTNITTIIQTKYTFTHTPTQTHKHTGKTYRQLGNWTNRYKNGHTDRADKHS